MTNDFELIKDYATREHSGRVIGRRLITLSEIDSTNTYIKSVPKAEDGLVVIADLQTQGKGRLGRNWISPAGSGLWMSILLRPSFGTDQFFLLTFLAAVSVAESIQRVTGLQPNLKWPNDVLIGQKKCCGILLESSISGELRQVVVGIGLNVNQLEFGEALSGQATSLFIESGQAWSRISLLESILNEMDNGYRTLNKEIISRWKSMTDMFGKKVQIRGAEKETDAEAVDLAADGGLIVRRNGELETIYAADVSVRMV